MVQYTLEPCTLADAPALARNNMPAFWQDKTWALTWKHTTLEEHIKVQGVRYARRLLADHKIQRHMKAVDEAGNVVGYARWLIPAERAKDDAGNLVWPEFLGPTVTDKENAEIEKAVEATSFNPGSDTDAIDEKIQGLNKEVKASLTTPYINLDYLAIHPDQQGKGIGTLLLKKVMECAADLKLDMYILACKPGFRLYEKMGFTVLRELVQDDSMFGGDGKYTMRYLLWTYHDAA
ncbi:hypothetical protein VHEMI02824 [[Torrubiella] hemipterigena]|uniref:N-acetyltransferase domain-containing protein n=1 Tax=[Torrubiella] hemipterigena TaxID=1531966 RepID=A0A0A1SWV2_9HYPO|nr:hypothetical protein VHEMI02824 [[Torrubiella] hemipterigena]